MVIITKSRYGKEKMTVDKKDLGKIQEKLLEIFNRKDGQDSVDLEFEEIVCQTSNGEVNKRVITFSYYPVKEEKKKLFG